MAGKKFDILKVRSEYEGGRHTTAVEVEEPEPERPRSFPRFDPLALTAGVQNPLRPVNGGRSGRRKEYDGG